MDYKSFNERDYELFLSYSHKDKEVVNQVADWLQNAAGIDVFLDVSRLKAGDTIVNLLPEMINESKGGLIFISKDSVKSGWIKEEYNYMVLQRTQHPDFKIIPVKLDDTEIPAFIQTTIWIDIREKKVDKDCIRNILSAIYPSNGGILSKAKDVYVSFGWRSSEIETSTKICSYFIKAGFRLVGDKTDHKIFDPDSRIRTIMESCGAVLIIAPDRGGKTSVFVEEELRTAYELGMKYILIAADNLTFEDELVNAAVNGRCYRFSEFLTNGELVRDVLAELREIHKGPVNKHFSFYGTSFLNGGENNLIVKKLIEQITGIECVFGSELKGKKAQPEIINRISKALFMIADVSEGNYNTLIEAGIALGAGTRLFLVCKGKTWSHRFMLQDTEKQFYEDDMQLLGAIHKFASLFGRRIINNEEAFKNV